MLFYRRPGVQLSWVWDPSYFQDWAHSRECSDEREWQNADRKAGWSDGNSGTGSTFVPQKDVEVLRTILVAHNAGAYPG